MSKLVVYGSLEKRFLSRVILGDGCWEMVGYHDKDGYAGISSGGSRGTSRALRAHRVAYELFVGPISEDLQPDHLCRNTGCVNPWHMELVTPRENILRSSGPAAVNAMKTHCLRGHEFTADNTWTNGIRRQCKTCLHERYEKYRAAKKGGDLSHAVL